MIKIRKDIDRVLENIRSSNKGRRIKIRMRKGNGGYSVFLQFWNGYKHEYSFYSKKYLARENTKNEDNEYLRMVEKDRSDKDFELFQNEQDFVLKNHLSKADFIKFYEVIGQKKGSRPQYVTSLMHFKKFIGRDSIQFKELQPKLFRDFREYLLNLKVPTKRDPRKLVQAMKPVTARGYLDTMRAGLNVAIVEQIIRDNPLKGIDIKVEETKREHLTENELKAFINITSDFPEIKQAFLFSCFTGLRLGDVQGLKLSDFEDNNLNFRQQKTKKVENFPLSVDALKIYSAQKEKYSNKGKVFDLPHKSNINRHLKELAKEAGIKKNLHYHMSRHTFAILALTSGMSIYEVSKFLGHTDIKTTEIYLKFVPEHKKEAISKLPSFLK
jgi:integrase